VGARVMLRAAAREAGAGAEPAPDRRHDLHAPKSSGNPT
jgi:hypothetical protein